MSLDALDKIRQQFDFAPFPAVPLEEFPRDDLNLLYMHSLVAPYYQHHRAVPSPAGQLILDAGCGSGYKSLLLAAANPGATVIGVDISAESVELSRQRLQYHGFETAEFHAIGIEELPSLGLEFDYINCDETLYLLPDPQAGLTMLQAVLKPGGIVRGNLHNRYQRRNYYQAQALFGLMGLMDDNPQDMEIDLVLETMQALKPETFLRRLTWQPIYLEKPKSVLVDYLLLGDKGFAVPDMFAMLREAGLEFVSMVNACQWQLEELFHTPQQLPEVWTRYVARLSVEQRLRAYELINPAYRLLDFWGAKPGRSPAHSLDLRQEKTWPEVTVHLHPLLCRPQVKAALVACCEQRQPFDFGEFLSYSSGRSVLMLSELAACLLPLWEAPQSVGAIAQRYRTLNPVHPQTLEPIDPAAAQAAVQQLLLTLEQYLYVLFDITE